MKHSRGCQNGVRRWGGIHNLPPQEFFSNMLTEVEEAKNTHKKYKEELMHPEIHLWLSRVLKGSYAGQSWSFLMSNVDGFDVIRPEDCGTNRTPALAVNKGFLYACVAEKMVTFGNDNLESTRTGDEQ
ncbi:hypothetical protein QJS04_geneDACA018436 [Acorus gramineus]|uniref:Uncharacterized protein n=1 Tax=Acorus gramineus TaxID=55184 RepID=A0AAV9AB53_ACOGR|nr:hypothetical protein QJS04_geneDACA018436 [Acorus gramineus]